MKNNCNVKPDNFKFLKTRKQKALELSQIFFSSLLKLPDENLLNVYNEIREELISRGVIKDV